jgi:hypothetical protein
MHETPHPPDPLLKCPQFVAPLPLAREDSGANSDLDFLVIERSVDDRIAEAVRLRRALGEIGMPVEISVLDEELAGRGCRGRWFTTRSAMGGSSPNPEQLTT